MGVSARPGIAGDCDLGGGELIRAAGVPWRGGDWPRESDKAAAKADTPGPCEYELPPTKGESLSNGFTPGNGEPLRVGV